MCSISKYQRDINMISKTFTLTEGSQYMTEGSQYMTADVGWHA